MPLLRGTGRDTIGRNIGLLVREGRPQRQAVAIAYSVAGKSRRTPTGLRRTR